MKLINKTKWDTKDLRKICFAVLKHEGANPHTRITCVTAKTCFYSGLASIGGSWIRMRIPAKKYVASSKGVMEQVTADFDIKDFGQTLIHEIGHNKGLYHSDMVSVRRIDTSFLDGYEVRQKEILKKPKRDFVGERYGKAVKYLNLHMHKLEREKKLVKKWTKRVGYYMKKGLRK